VKRKLHWQVLAAMLLAVAVGGFVQTRPAEGWLGLEVARPEAPGAWGDRGLLVRGVAAGGPAAGVGMRVGDVILELGGAPVPEDPGEFEGWQRGTEVGGRVELTIARPGLWGVERRRVDLASGIHPRSARARWIAPFDFAGDLFLRLLRMLIVPLILTSIVTGVAGVGSSARLGRLFTKTFAYYLTTSLLAVLTGLFFVSVIGPGRDSALPLTNLAQSVSVGREEGIADIFLEMIPDNPVAALASGTMLQIIFFALVFGFFLTRIPGEGRDLLIRVFRATFEVMMGIAGFVLRLIPFGVFALIVKITGQTGFAVFRPLAWYMLTVVLGLLFHVFVTLPLLLRLVGRIRPLPYARAVSPALVTAFSTSSSSVTLPVTIESVEKRGGVSNEVSSFVLPLGATINMDGTALYECVAVIFLAQFYSLTAGFDLTLVVQLKVVLMALLASIGAAGIPSAGLVMMLTILTALDLPLEGAALILMVDRPLDMLRTMANVWSDSCGTAIVARTEGEANAGVYTDA